MSPGISLRGLPTETRRERRATWCAAVVAIVFAAIAMVSFAVDQNLTLSVVPAPAAHRAAPLGRAAGGPASCGTVGNRQVPPKPGTVPAPGLAGHMSNHHRRSSIVALCAGRHAVRLRHPACRRERRGPQIGGCLVLWRHRERAAARAPTLRRVRSRSPSGR